MECAWEDFQELPLFAGIAISGPEGRGFRVVWMWVGWGGAPENCGDSPWPQPPGITHRKNLEWAVVISTVGEFLPVPDRT